MSQINKVFVLFVMVFCHVVDDYYLQGILASLKQKKWWEKNYPDGMYKKDYIVGLFMHSFSWAFLTMLPVAIYYGLHPSITFYMCLIVNLLIHMLVDDQKANRLRINLVIDQTIHIVQILITYTILIV